MHRTDSPGQFVSGNSRHLNIHQKHIRGCCTIAAGEKAKRGFAVDSLQYLMPVEAKHHGQDLQANSVIVHQKDSVLRGCVGSIRRGEGVLQTKPVPAEDSVYGIL